MIEKPVLPPTPPAEPSTWASKFTFRNVRGVILGGWLLVGMPILIWRSCHVPGEEVGELSVPGEMEVDLAIGDGIAFTADTDVLFARPSSKAKPKGCVLTLTLGQDGNELASTRCDLFNTSENTDASWSSSTYNVEGQTRMVITGQRLGCRMTSPAAGRLTIAATTNLEDCVTRTYAVTAQVHVDPAKK